MRKSSIGVQKTRTQSLANYFKWHYLFYLMLLPGIIYIVIFKYLPMYGIVIAFKNYKITTGILNSPWVGLDNFKRLFATAAFLRALKNNIFISFYKFVFGFPLPIILSLMINEVRRSKLKKFIQTAVILPNFISWVVVSGLMYAILSPNTGALRSVFGLFGYKGAFPNILTDKTHFQAYLVITYDWKGIGMGTIVYLAAIAGIDQNLYEAAIIDGAGRWRQIWHITLSSIRPMIITLLIFRVGEIMYAGFDQIYAMSNDLVISVADIIDTYVYRVGLGQRNYSISTAAGLFQSFIGMILVLITNGLARKFSRESAVM
jgi:putative aldouronate transport system permease protein